MWIPHRLDTAKFKMGISLTDPRHPKATLQILPTILRMNPAGPIRNCSKAPGVFSSNYRYPASSPEVHFHRASPRDSSPVITPFVHVGTYPTRNYALRFLLAREGPYLSPQMWSMTYGLLESMLDKVQITPYSGNLAYSVYTYNRPSPSGRDRSHVRNLRTIIVIADIHRGLHSPAYYRSSIPPVVDLPALVRCHPLYFLLRVCRELCFW